MTPIRGWGRLCYYLIGRSSLADETDARAGMNDMKSENLSSWIASELGERIMEVLGKHAAQAMCEILEGKLPPDQWHSPLWPRRFLFTNPFMVWFFNRILGIEKGVA